MKTPEIGEDQISRVGTHSSLSIIMTDPGLDDNPITYVNRAFEAMTLYSRDYAVGRNCRFLQGPETDQRDVERIREGLRSGEEFEVVITNHRADGTPFRNRLLVAPIFGGDGELSAHLGVLRVVDDEADSADPNPDGGDLALLRELQHRVKNHLAMVVSMIRLQARREVTADSLKAISRRIEALALLYEELLNVGGNGNGSRVVHTGAYLSRIVSVVTSLEARKSIRVNAECEEISLPFDDSARLGLLLSEFLTNALQHAFRGREVGCVEVGFCRRSDGGVRLSVRDDGIGMPEGSNWPTAAPSIERQKARAQHHEGELDTTGHGTEPGVGGSIVAALTDSLGATLAVTREEEGTLVTVEVEPKD